MGDLSAHSELGSLDEAAEAAADARSVGGVLLAGTDLGRHQRYVVPVLVPPDLAALVTIRVRRSANPASHQFSLNEIRTKE